MSLSRLGPSTEPPFSLRIGHYQRFVDLSSDNGSDQGPSIEFVTIQEFVLRRADLVLHSTYFAEVLTDHNFPDNKINIENETDLKQFNFWYNFVKNRRLRDNLGRKIGWKTVEDLLEGYLLGEILGATHFMDAVMDEMLRKFKSEPHKAYVTSVWEYTEKNSLLRKMFIELTACGSAKCLRIENADDYPNNFLKMVFQLYWAWRPDKRHANIFVPEFTQLPSARKEVGGCRYHDHARIGLPCYRDVFSPQAEATAKITNG